MQSLRDGLGFLLADVSRLMRREFARRMDGRLSILTFAQARALVQSGEYDLVVLDELVTATFFELLSLDAVLAFLAMRPAAVELVMTGRGAPEELIAAADLVTEMRPVKHYYDAGVLARPGIEY